MLGKGSLVLQRHPSICCRYTPQVVDVAALSVTRPFFSFGFLCSFSLLLQEAEGESSMAEGSCVVSKLLGSNPRIHTGRYSGFCLLCDSVYGVI
jgi:hypothetical protein